MWVSGKRLKLMEKRIADLEKEVQGQPQSAEFDPSKTGPLIQDFIRHRNESIHDNAPKPAWK